MDGLGRAFGSWYDANALHVHIVPAGQEERKGMITGYVLALREGLEAALILGVALGAVRRVRQPRLTRSVWLGVITAAALSLVLGWALHRAGAGLEGPAEAVFEGAMMLLAAGILTWMIFWMQTQGRRLQTELAAGIQQAAVAGQGWALFSLAFLAVLREGIEAAIFLTAAALTAGASATFLGGLLGLLSAVLLGWALYAATLRLDIRRFFTLTGLLLLFFAAGLVTHGLHEFIELGWLPGLIQHVWSTSRILPEASSFGQVLKALVGYNDSPSLTEALSYFAYIALITLALLRRGSPVRGPKPGTLA